MNIPQIVHDAIAVHGALQKPGELTGLCDVLGECDPPKVVVEIGSDAGGTLYVWRQLWPDAWVYSVTLQGGPYSTGFPLAKWGAEVISGDSHDLATKEQLESALLRDCFPAQTDLLIVDGDHTRQGCSDDVAMYGPLVRTGGLLVLHDICHHAQPDVDVEHVWANLDPSLWTKLCEIVAPPENWGGIGVAIRC